MDIEKEPIEYQARYWRVRALSAEERLEKERKRKEPGIIAELEEKLKDSQDTIRILRDDVVRWKQIAGVFSQRTVDLESEGPAALLKKERDHWRNQWKNCTRRLGNCIEHLGLAHSGVEPNADEA